MEAAGIGRAHAERAVRAAVQVLTLLACPDATGLFPVPSPTAATARQMQKTCWAMQRTR